MLKLLTLIWISAPCGQPPPTLADLVCQRAAACKIIGPGASKYQACLQCANSYEEKYAGLLSVFGAANVEHHIRAMSCNDLTNYFVDYDVLAACPNLSSKK